MHILGLIIMLLISAAVWYSRLKALGGAARDAGKVAQRVRNAPRKFAFKHRAGQTGLNAVDDPREAATILMVLVSGAFAAEPLDDVHRNLMDKEIMAAFEFSLKEADELITLALWRVQDVDFPQATARRMSKLIARDPDLPHAAKADLDDILGKLLKARWDAAPVCEEVVDIYRNSVGL